jgi:hypothetical protein
VVVVKGVLNAGMLLLLLLLRRRRRGASGEDTPRRLMNW